MFFSLLSIAFSQVGINTNEPNSQLDVNGDVSIRGKLYTEGTDTVLGNPGNKGQVLVSSGSEGAPKWQTLNIPNDIGKYYLIYNNTFNDRNGILFKSSEATGSLTYTKGNLLNSLSKWKKIPDLSSQHFEVYSNNNKVYLTFETVAHLGSQSQNAAAEFACGIFIDEKLEGVRVNTVEQTSTATFPFKTFTMLHVSENISKGTHKLDVACVRRSNFSSDNIDLTIGRNINGTTNLNNFMAQSNVKIEVYEIPDQYIDID